MSELIERLARQIVQDNAILFVGAELRRGEGQLPAVQRIAEVLAQRIGYDEPDRSLQAVAQSFEVREGRNELILAIREELEKLGAQPTPVHQLLADAVLPYTKVITTRFDQSLEQALQQFGKRYVLIVRDTDVPAFDETQVTLIKIHGDITQSDSLVITEDDIDDFIDNLPTISDLIRAFFATKTLIFLGYDLNSDLFKRFYRQVGRNVSVFQRPAYAIVPQPLKETRAQYWKKQNVEISVRDPIVFLEELAHAVKDIGQEPALAEDHPLEELARPQLPSRPYKALDSFAAADAAIFVGRDEESQRLASRILANRLTVLYGESGSGKTSLLQAGVGPRLADQKALLCLCSPAPGQYLGTLMRDGLLDAGQRAGLISSAGDDLLGSGDRLPAAGDKLPALIRTWQRILDGPLVLAIDQFEQFFLAYSRDQQAEAVDLLSKLLADRSLDLRLVLVLREDFLGRLQLLEDPIPGLLDVRFRLERLGREAARAAVEEPARLFGVRWESALVQTLLDDLYESAGGGVAPPQLQIVCDHLFQQVEGEDDSLITLALFRARGGTQAILGDYLDRALGEFSPQDRPAVRAVLGALVGSSGLKQRLAIDDLARAADVGPDAVTAILDELTRQRVVRRYEVNVEGRQAARPEVELTHDYLAARIATWLGDEFWDAQRAREIVRQALPDWHGRDRLLAPDDLRLVVAQQGRVRFSAEETELIYASAAGYDGCLADCRTPLDRVACRRILLRLMGHAESSVRQHAACALAAFPDDGVAYALAQAAVSDADPPVREAAAQAIAGLGGVRESSSIQAAVDQLVDAVSETRQEEAARKALVTVRDLRPSIQKLLPASLRGSIRRQVWGLRWQRSRQRILSATLQGIQGGFWGMGLGMGLFYGLYGINDLSQVKFNILLGLMIYGLSLGGVLGSLSAGGSAFIRETSRSLQDGENPIRTWLIVTTVGTVLFSLGWSLLGYVSPAARSPLETLAAGLIMGLAITIMASAPLRLVWPLRLGLAALVSIGAFMLAGRLGLFVSGAFRWQILMGAASGVGFFWALNPGFWRKDSSSRQ